MITLDELLRDLSYGEFSLLNIGNFLPDEHESDPDPKSYAQLSSWFNIALGNIYSEFLLASEELYITQIEEATTYTLSYEYAVSNTGSTKDPKYITDTVGNPFKDNILKIESVYDEEGNPVALNNALDVESCYTPTYRTLQVPWPNEFGLLTVQYRAGPAKIAYVSGMDPSTIDVAVPHSLREALLWYVASRGFAAMSDGQGGGQAAEYYQKYRSRVLDVRTQGLYIQTEADNNFFDTNGWV